MSEKPQDQLWPGPPEPPVERPRPRPRSGLPPSLNWFLAGFAPWALLPLAWVSRLGGFPYHVIVISVSLGVLASPFLFFIGARAAWTERDLYGTPGRVSRLLNVLGLAVSIGSLATLVMANVWARATH